MKQTFAKSKIFESKDLATEFCCAEFCRIANEKKSFRVALSGGSAPKPLYERLTGEYASAIDWSKVHLFWSDERDVPLDHPDSNYKMAMEAGFQRLPIPEKQIHPFVDADTYEKLLEEAPMDLVLLGMGADGHTASLFPKTHALHSGERLAVDNFLTDKDIWRRTFTFKAIGQATHVFVLVFGEDKAGMIKKVFESPPDPNLLPIQGITAKEELPLFILDKQAALNL